MKNIKSIISNELNLKEWQVENTVELKESGATVPFISRYRKERTGELNENVVREIFDKFDYYTELEDRKAVILESIDSQGKLTEELKKKIEDCLKKSELEDIYLPFKPKRRTRATIAREKGLQGLADLFVAHNTPDSPYLDIDSAASDYINAELGVETVEDAINGASDIIAEDIAQDFDARAYLREFILRNGNFTSRKKETFSEDKTKFDHYADFSISVKKISAHNMLALRRGENEGILILGVEYDEDTVLSWFGRRFLKARNTEIIELFTGIIKDAYSRLMKNSIISDVRLMKKNEADEESINIFDSNMKQILLASPAGMKITIGIDPGFRTGCKAAVVDNTGKFLEYRVLFPFASVREKEESEKVLIDLFKKYNPELVAIGNGTAGRETDLFVGDLIKKHEVDLIKVLVSEAGASVYSAGESANREFPELDLTIRGAISIARRLQDPLAELVKIDPKSIGVGQYQHDVDQKLLGKKLNEVVESCVNFVGVDINTASKELLSYVSGITSSLAEKIIGFRDDNGAFNSRKDLLKVPKFGPKAFEQSAGFLRIRNGANILDNTAVHPESYAIVKKIAEKNATATSDIIQNKKLLDSIDLNQFVTDSVGLPTLKDIVEELLKPGRDPREEYKYVSYKDGINSIDDLKEGMELEGVVTNLTKFGAFVDIGVHQDGLVHISEIANQFISDPTKHLSVGQIVNTLVISIDTDLKRIALSIKRLLK